MTGRMKLRLVVAVALVGWARALSVRGVPEVQAYLAPHVPRDDDLACIISGTEAATLLQLRKQAPPSGVHRVEGAFSVDLGLREARACAVHPEGLTPLLDNLSVTAEAPSATWEELAKAKKRGGAWRLYGAELQLEMSKVEGFSERTGRTASLYPVEQSTPTVLLAGFGVCPRLSPPPPYPLPTPSLPPPYPFPTPSPP